MALADYVKRVEGNYSIPNADEVHLFPAVGPAVGVAVGAAAGVAAGLGAGPAAGVAVGLAVGGVTAAVVGTQNGTLVLRAAEDVVLTVTLSARHPLDPLRREEPRGSVTLLPGVSRTFTASGDRDLLVRLGRTRPATAGDSLGAFWEDWGWVIAIAVVLVVGGFVAYLLLSRARGKTAPAPAPAPAPAVVVVAPGAGQGGAPPPRGA